MQTNCGLHTSIWGYIKGSGESHTFTDDYINMVRISLVNILCKYKLNKEKRKKRKTVEKESRSNIKKIIKSRTDFMQYESPVDFHSTFGFGEQA